jgi:phosphoribosylformylglycinamidine synthase PurS subunit
VGLIRNDCPVKLPDGQQSPLDGLKIQQRFYAEKFPEINFGGNRDNHCDFFQLAGCSDSFHFLHCIIFSIQKQNNMIFTVQVKVMPLRELLDPQGKAVVGGLQNLGLKNINEVRIGKNISLQIEADTPSEATQIAEEASKKLLANPVMEYFEISVN